MESTLQILESILSPKPPVSFKEFCESPDFCNDNYIYPYWHEEYAKVPALCSELLIDGSLGGGKSYVAAYYIAYRVYCLFLYGDPRPRFGLAPNTPMYVLYFSTSMTQARRSGFNYLYAVFEKCKWFKDNYPIDTNLKSSVRFPNNFEICYASAEGHQIGLNVWGFILDEANFRNGVGQGTAEEYEEVTALYTQLLDRQISRFSTPDGVNSLAVLISSASYQSSFTEKRKQVIKENKHGHIITSISYKIKPWQYSKEMFKVFIGAGNVEPKIIESEEQLEKVLRVANLYGTGQESNYVYEVPVSIKQSFEANIALALQNHCGVPTMIKGKFMSNLKPLWESYADLPRYFLSNDLEASTADDTRLIENLITENVVYPERPHSIFIDLSVQGDIGGITCTRFDGEVDGVRKHTKVFTLGIKPPMYPNQTRITKIQDFVMDLSTILNIVAVGSDQYQSTQMRQELNLLLGLEDIRMSIDSTDTFHLHWQRALVDKRVKNEKDEDVEREVSEAEHDLKRHRVLKRKGSTDDKFQSVVGSFWLSDTVGAQYGDISDLYGPRMNIVGHVSAQKMMSKLGVKEIKPVAGQPRTFEEWMQQNLEKSKIN